MKTSLLLTAAIAIPVAALATTSSANFGCCTYTPTASARHSQIAVVDWSPGGNGRAREAGAGSNGGKVPSINSGNGGNGGAGGAWVDVAVSPGTLNGRITSNATGAHYGLRVTLAGTGRGGQAVRFARVTIPRPKNGTRVLRLHVPRAAHASFVRARRVTATLAVHWDSPSDADANANVVGVDTATVFDRRAQREIAARAARDCPGVIFDGRTGTGRRCDLAGVDLAGADLGRADLRGAHLDGAHLDGANLSKVRLAGASLIGTTMKGAILPPQEQVAFTQPQDGNSTRNSTVPPNPGGGTIQAAISSATRSVDVVMYDFGSTNVVGWLQAAITRGVNVRVIVNSGLLEKTCVSVSPPSPGCVWSPKADPTYAMERQLQVAQQRAGSGAGSYRVQFSSENFQITHQKTIIIDGADASGNPLPANQLPATAKAIVSTGNLQAFPNFWGQRSVAWTQYNADGTSQKFGPFLINPDYLDNPDASCTTASARLAKPPYNLAGAGQPCAAEWAPRDFGITVTQPDIVSRIEGVFASDARCDGPTVDNVQMRTASGTTYTGLIPDPKGSDPVSNTWPETWSNGAMAFPPSGQSGAPSYPPANPGYFNAVNDPTWLRGNALSRMSTLINSAKKSIWVYNEEMNYSNKTGTGLVDLLVAQAKSGVDVRVVMSGTVGSGNTWLPAYNKLVAAGAQVRLLDESAGQVYVHAKAILVDGTDGWIGSQNIGYASINWNRELGIGFTDRLDPTSAPIASVLSVTGVNQVQTTFATDFAAGTPWPSGGVPGPPAPPTPAAGTTPSFSQLQMPCIAPAINPDSGLPPRDPNAVAAPPQGTTGP